jgi:hypothetical protein
LQLVLSLSINFSEEDVMKKVVVFALLLNLVLFHVAKADTMKDFVRISCVPEAGLLDIEFRSLHDSVAVSPNAQDDRSAILAREGFQNPHGLKFSCELGGVTYHVSADQDQPSEQRICGEVPEVYLNVARGDDKILSDVVFGESCNQLPSVTRITVGESPKSWRGRETQVCYSTGKDSDAVFCDWTFGRQAEFDKHFPIDEKRIQRIVTHEERR